jgi:hypothetical protein
MSDQGQFGREYSVPIYDVPADAAWYHFLYGSVPGHQIDFIVRPEVPHGALSPQHFSHLLRLIKYVESREGEPFAFAIANLSRDDTQHVPGHGGLALIFGLRVRNATDHTGRPEPPFSHVIAAVDRELDASVIEAAALSFYRRMAGCGAGDSEGVALYRAYAALAGSDPGAAAGLAAKYVKTFGGLPCAPRAVLGQKWRAEGPEPAKRIVVVHPDEAPFSSIVSCAARLASILYRSDVRWTSITTGREVDITNGVSILLVRERDPHGNGCGAGLTLRAKEIPREDADAARALFGARPIERRGHTTARAGGRHEQSGRADAQEEAERAQAGKEAREQIEVPKYRAPTAPEESRPADNLDDAPTLVMSPEPTAPAQQSRRRLNAKMWPFALVGGLLCAAALAFMWGQSEQQAVTLAPIPLEATAAAAVSSSSSIPKAVRKEVSAKQGAHQGDRAASPATSSAAPTKPLPPRPVVVRGVAGRRTDGALPPSAKRDERATEGPIFRGLPPP